MRRASAVGSIAVACYCLAPVMDARADAPSVLVIAADAAAGTPQAEVVQAVRDALGDFDEVTLLPPPPLDLEAVQLALDCGDESAECLAEIAHRMDAEIVVVPSLVTRRDALELRVVAGTRRAGVRLAIAMRKQAGKRLDRTLLDAVPGALREVLRLDAGEQEPEPTEPPKPQPIAPLAAPQPLAEPAPEQSSGPSVGQLLLGGGGLALIASGAVVGAIAGATEDQYASRTIDTEAQAEDADALRVRGRREALIANVLLGTGAAALVGAGIWYVLDGGAQSEPERATVRPWLGPGTAGLMLAGPMEAPR